MIAVAIIGMTRLAATALAPAKVNLTLEVLGRRTDGYHEIRTWIAVAAAAGDARGAVLAYQPVPAWSTGCAVASLDLR